MQESSVKTKMVKEVKAAGGYARRIEDQFGVGIPDLIMILPGSPVYFAEVKIIKGNVFSPSERQFIEMGRMYISDKVEPIMVGWKNGKHYIGLPEKTLTVDKCMAQRDDENFAQMLRRWWYGGQ